MPKFEVGDKVKVVALDTRWDAYTPHLNNYLGRIGIITGIKPDCKNEKNMVYLIRFDEVDVGCFFMPESWLELVEKKKPGYWTGQIVITDKGSSNYFTTGKVYDVKNGLLYDDTGTPYSNGHKFEALDEIQDFLGDTFNGKCIEFKGFTGRTEAGKDE